MAIRFTQEHVKKAYAYSCIRLVGSYRNVFKKIHLVCELCEHEWDEMYDFEKKLHCPECNSIITEKVESKKVETEETEESPAQEKKSRRRSRKFELKS